MRPTTSKYIEVRKSNIHSTGVFAVCNIRKGTKIIEYVGEKIGKEQAEDRYAKTLADHQKDKTNGAVYIFEVNKNWDIDGNVPYNTAKYINHSCEPNCEVEIIDDRIWIMALRKIKKGEELSYNYGYDLEDYEDHPCRCGSKNCVGFIVDDDHWPDLKKILRRKRR